MVARAGPPRVADGTAGRPAPLAALAASSRALAEGSQFAGTLTAIVGAVAESVGAGVAVARVLDGGCDLRTRAVVTGSASLAALLEGSLVPAAEVLGETDETGELPRAVRAAALAAGAEAVLVVPVVLDGTAVGTLELLRARRTFSPEERLLARATADHVAAAIRSLDRPVAQAADGAAVLELAGEALGAAGDDATAEDGIARVALRAAGATACLVWRRDEQGRLRFVASQGETDAAAVAQALPLAEQAVTGVLSPAVEVGPGATAIVTLPLGQPPAHVLQLIFPETEPPTPGLLAGLAPFGARAANALRAAAQAGELRVELDRTRALLEVVAQANEELSLAHALQTAIDRVADLVGVDRMGIYLRDEGHLTAAAARGLAGPHESVAERLLELALGPFRGRGMLVFEAARSEPALAHLDAELAKAGIEAAVAVPLLVPDEVVGLLAVYPPAGRSLSANERALLSALAAQLAVSVQNARLHEQATQLGTELEQVLALERQAARQLGSLYEISRSFAQSLSLEATLEAVASTVVELLRVDAAVIRMPDARGELLVPRAVQVADPHLAAALRAVISRPQPLEALPRRRLRTGRAILLDPALAARLPAHQALVPFLERGATAVVIPIATSTELLGTVELVSLDPARPITRETADIGLSVAAQAALAIDNARLYQHQKEFSDTMQRSLLPREGPQIPGIELGDVYASSSRLDVGGDLYDFMRLEDGRLAVVLGDVTGHGVDAAADMAMAKFVFRSLAREHPEPADFLTAANEVVCGEIAPGKFITMLYLTIDAATGAIVCASAGHPRPRVLLPDGTVRVLEPHGLALGIEPGQAYPEASEELPPGASIVLYTDGVVEARRDGELYGPERLDALLAKHASTAPGELAQAVIEDCRAYGRGELADDCAIVVVKRTAA
ncbi:MAG: SpoIIE family protein phosphatase [Gaiellaceae bacterium]